MSDKTELTIDQKIAVARMATDIVTASFQSKEGLIALRPDDRYNTPEIREVHRVIYHGILATLNGEGTTDWTIPSGSD